MRRVVLVLKYACEWISEGYGAEGVRGRGEVGVRPTFLLKLVMYKFCERVVIL